MRILSRGILAIAFLAAVMGLPMAQAEESLPGVPLRVSPAFADVEFARVPRDGGVASLRMNIYPPSQPRGTASPALVFVHGGAWLEGDYSIAKELNGLEANSNYHAWFAMREKGVAIVTIGYRLSSEAVFPAQIHDVKGAIRFLRAEAAQYGIDPERIAIAGTSAGAHLALLCALSGGVAELEGETGGNLDQSSRVMACVDYYGMTDFTTLAADIYRVPWLITGQDAYELVDAPTSSRSRLFGLDKGQGKGLGAVIAHGPVAEAGSWEAESLRLVKLGSPIFHVTPDDPPVFIGNGARDHRVPVAQSAKLFDALQRAGIESYLMVNSRVGHEDLGSLINAASVAFLLEKFGLTDE